MMQEEFMDIIKWLGITDRHKKMYLNKKLAPFGLSSQHLYLLKVCRNPGITQDQFLESFYLNPSNVTRAVLSLEQKGFLYRESCEEDKRTCRLFPTEKGIEVCRNIEEVWADTENTLMEGFSQEEKEIFQRLLIKAGNNMLSKLGADQNKRRRKR